MKKILFLEGSLDNSDNSYSTVTMNKLYDKLVAQGHQVEKFNLNDTHSKVFLTNSTWKTYFNDINSDFWIDKLKETDLLVISESMTNFGAAAVVKNFIDSIAVANKTFSYKYSKKGDAVGLLDTLNVLVVASQGAPRDWYQWGSHISWLVGTFNFLGAKKVDTIEITGTKTALFKDTNPEAYYEDNKELFEAKLKGFDL
ncbi:FMN-dependent NADH-azoreductase [Mycoplasma sp. OR1901]|uniref:FMN-dependent NADH-azoreductase n=1 Tax=Mycoplasma sp. OR1901 TaxID=2742195 RepID=UPI0015820363|nr:FMN-dependent NADH-azoreductase [Mycoplasma sp. OR1901]QKT05509.1 FMN-dependent NADH-azoreductase [Mycoplasma sp. OR1901]